MQRSISSTSSPVVAGSAQNPTRLAASSGKLVGAIGYISLNAIFDRASRLVRHALVSRVVPRKKRSAESECILSKMEPNYTRRLAL